MTTRVQALLAKVEQSSTLQLLRVLLTQQFVWSQLRVHYDSRLTYVESEISSAQLDKANNSLTIVQTVLSLFGPVGFLPDYLLDLLYSEKQQKQSGLKDFLAIFNQRFWLLMCEAWCECEFIIQAEREQASVVTDILTAVMPTGVNDYYFAGHYARGHLSLCSLQQQLQYYFQLPMQLLSQKGVWVDLAATETTRLGQQHSALTAGVVLGGRAFMTQHVLHVEVGPLTYDDYCQLLPGSKKRVALEAYALARLPKPMTVHINTQLLPGVARQTRLNSATAQLGWTSWL